MIGLLAALGAIAATAIAAARLFVGPTLQDRALAFNAIALMGVVICAALAAAAREAAWIDVAFALLIAVFAIDIAVLKFFRQNSFQAPLAHSQER